MQLPKAANLEWSTYEYCTLFHILPQPPSHVMWLNVAGSERRQNSKTLSRMNKAQWYLGCLLCEGARDMLYQNISPHIPNMVKTDWWWTSLEHSPHQKHSSPTSNYITKHTWMPNPSVTRNAAAEGSVKPTVSGEARTCEST